MNTAAFRRIVWKEARAQFSLWLALVFGAFLLQITILETQGVHAQGLGFVATASFVLTACFAVASVAMLFAGEQEDGTRDWLRQLPVRPFVLAGAKLAFAAVAVALFFAATWGTGMLATTVIGRPAGDLFRADYSRGDVSFASILGVAGWGLLFSLLGRRVVFVLFAAVVTEILTVAIVDNVYPTRSSFLGNPQTADLGLLAVHLTIVAIVFAIDLVLTLRWATAGAGPAARLSATHRRRGIAIPWQEAREQWWLRVVQCAASRGSPQARETAVLVWRELRTAVPFGLTWLVVGILATDLLSLASWNDRILRARPFQVLYLIVTPVVCGLLTCLGDQRQQMFRFLGERGVSPPRVWWIKQGFWLATAVLLSVACLRCDLSLAGIIERGWPQQRGLLMELMERVRIPGQELLIGRQHVATPEDWALRRALFASLLLALYAAGQWASFRIRRPILAFSSMLIVVPVLVGWHALLIGMDIPLWLCSWPLTLTLLAATLGSAGAWLRGRDTWTLRFTHLAAVALPAIAVITAAAAHRAFSVPAPVFPSDVANAINARNATFDAYDTEWSRRWRQTLEPFELRDSLIPKLSLSKAACFAFLDELIQLADDIPGSHGRLDPLVYSPDSRIHVPSIANFLASPYWIRADGATVANVNALDDQWRDYEAGLRITGYLSQQCQSDAQYQECLRSRVPLLAAIETWAARADQTPESLQRAFDFLAHDLQTPLMAREMYLNRYAFYEQLLEHRGRKWAEIERQIERDGGFASQFAMVAGAVGPPFERERILRLLGHATAELLSPAASIIEQQQLVRRSATTPSLPLNIPMELRLGPWPSLPSTPYTTDGAFLLSRAQQSGAALLVALQLYRLEHGEFPPLLSSVTPQKYAGALNDAYTNAPFGYEPHGLSSNLYLPDGRIIPAGQPLLWSAGARCGRIVELTAPMHLNGGHVIYAGEYTVSDISARSALRFVAEPLTQNSVRFVDASAPY